LSLIITIAREQDDLAWRVENGGPGEVWAFLLVPSIVDGRLSFDEDAAWMGQEDDETLVARKVDAAAVPSAALRELVPSGAVRLKPGETRCGRLAVGRLLEPPPGTDGPEGPRPRRVILEVGWLPAREEIQPTLLDWKGQPFAYLATADEPGGQRLTRSAPLDWTLAGRS
jgi:hypothetical protein